MNNIHQFPPPQSLQPPEAFETQRLLLRLPRREDAAPMLEAIEESRKELLPFIFWANRPRQSVEEAEALMDRLVTMFRERTQIRFHLIGKDTGQFLGVCSLQGIDWMARCFELGYWIRTSVSGRGLTTEAVDAVSRYAIEHLQAQRIELRCDVRNEASIRIAERLGFKLEGIMRHRMPDGPGDLRDVCLYAKVHGVEF